MGKRDGRAAGQQDDGIDRGDVERGNDILDFSEFTGQSIHRHVRSQQQRPDIFKGRPEEFVGGSAGPLSPQPRHGVNPGIEQGAEKRGEEHHFRKDEPRHAPAETDIHLFVVYPAQAFIYHVPEPDEEHVENGDKSQQQQVRTEARHAAGGEVLVKHECCAAESKKQGQGKQYRPFAGFRDKIRVLRI